MKKISSPQHVSGVRPFFNAREEGRIRGNHITHQPKTNIQEVSHQYIVKLAVPGLHREDFHVDCHHQVLTIAANCKKEGNVLLHENCQYDFLSWKKKFLLPDDADPLMATAAYDLGELTIYIPKSFADVKNDNAQIFVY